MMKQKNKTKININDLDIDVIHVIPLILELVLEDHNIYDSYIYKKGKQYFIRLDESMGNHYSKSTDVKEVPRETFDTYNALILINDYFNKIRDKKLKLNTIK